MMRRHSTTDGRAGWKLGMAPALAAMLCILALLTGCETKPGVIFPPLANAPSWPAPPDAPRIFYIGELRTSEDLKPGVSGLDAVGQAIFGKPDAQGMLSPIAVCTDGKDRIFVADSNAQCVHVFDLQTRRYAKWMPGKKSPPLAQPVGIAYDALHRRVLVSDSVAGNVAVFAADADPKNPKAPTYVGVIGSGVLERPVGIAVDPADGRIFVADAKAHQVAMLSSEGAVIRRIGQRGTRPGEFNFPTYLSFRDGRLYVSDSLNSRVQVLDVSGPEPTIARIFGRKGDMPGYFAQPKGVALDSEGHVYVVDAQFENVQLFDDRGRVLMDFGEEGGRPGQFWLPSGIFIDPQDRIYLADVYNKRIQVFDYRKAAEPTNGNGAASMPASASAPATRASDTQTGSKP